MNLKFFHKVKNRTIFKYFYHVQQIIFESFITDKILIFCV